MAGLRARTQPSPFTRSSSGTSGRFRGVQSGVSWQLTVEHTWERLLEMTGSPRSGSFRKAPSDLREMQTQLQRAGSKSEGRSTDSRVNRAAVSLWLTVSGSPQVPLKEVARFSRILEVGLRTSDGPF